MSALRRNAGGNAEEILEWQVEHLCAQDNVGAADFLNHPVQPDALSVKIRELVERAAGMLRQREVG